MVNPRKTLKGAFPAQDACSEVTPCYPHGPQLAFLSGDKNFRRTLENRRFGTFAHPFGTLRV